MKQIVFALGMLIMLAGCAGPGSLAGLNKEQLEALSKMKDAAALCVEADVTLYGGRMVMASVDKEIKGIVTVEEKCKVTINTK